MSDQTWFIDLDLKLDSPVSEDLLDDLIEAVEPLHGAVSPGMEMPTLGLSLAVEALDTWEASDLARKFLEVDLGSIMPNLEICSIRILNELTREAENETPTFPEMVAVPDIADILGVSRQQAHRLTKREGFPTPALTPRTGDLWVRTAVEAWKDRTERSVGRPRIKEGGTILIDESHINRNSDVGRTVIEEVARAARLKPRDVEVHQLDHETSTTRGYSI